ncbi:MAG: DUF4862 family protein [Alphaproteobacteria bacterium]|nr:DUF4862 family protein [Alphaproteobacteria bacterium]
MRFLIGAYAMSPAGAQWDEALEGRYIDGLKALPFMGGIEVPFFSALHRWDEDFFFRNADPGWDYVANPIPSVMGTLPKNPKFGLASTDEDGRRAALAAMEKVNAAVRRVNDRLGRRAFRAVELQSAPTGGRLNGGASPAAFTRSLVELGDWQWDGAELSVEHCDSAQHGVAPQKGFLTIEEEIAAITAANRSLAKPIGGSINWGRSVIDGRSVDTVARHTALLLAAGLMRGIILSGASGADTPYGAWADTHMPHGPEPYVDAGEPGALMTEREIAAFFAQTRGTNLTFVGIKIAIRPESAPLQRRLDMLRAAMLVTASAFLSAR